jgi:hypothetical protein
LALKPSSEPALQPASKKRSQTLLVHSPSRSALEDVLLGSPPTNGARPLHQRAALSIVFLSVFVFVISTVAFLLKRCLVSRALARREMLAYVEFS